MLLFWSMSGISFFYRHHVVLREQLYVPRESSVPNLLKFIDVVRHTETNLDTLEESIVDDIWRTLMNVESFQKIDAGVGLCESES